MIDAAIFDMDGVLVDNVSYHVRAWRRLGEQLGKELSEEDIKTVFGRRNREMLPALFDRDFSEEETARYSEQKEEVYRQLISPDLKPVPGLLDFLSDLRGQRVQTAVATSGPPKNVEFILGRLGIEPYFDEVVTGADVTRGKPHPEIFLTAAKKLTRRPERCVVFEDSPSGIEAAQRANCACVAVATTHSVEELAKLSPDLIILDFRGLDAAQIKQMGKLD
ncbi:MAG: HAD family hydrolase [Acidobacteriota bacterium]